jgi:hypothetical protein
MANLYGVTTNVASNDGVFPVLKVPTYYGVKSYANGTGDPLQPSQFGFMERILGVFPAFSVSGTYYAWGQPSGPGQAQWYLRWYVVGTNDEVSNGVNLSAEILQLMAVGI